MPFFEKEESAPPKFWRSMFGPRFKALGLQRHDELNAVARTGHVLKGSMRKH
jgi:hypothetical protein